MKRVGILGHDVMQYPLIAPASAIWLVIPVHTFAVELHVGEARLVYTDDEIPIRYDGSLSTLRNDSGQMLFFHSFGCRIRNNEHRRSRHSWHTGPPDDPLKTHLSSRTDEDLWDYNGWYENTEERGIWILGMYEAPGGDLLGITHSEVRYPGKRQQFALGKTATWNRSTANCETSCSTVSCS